MTETNYLKLPATSLRYSVSKADEARLSALNNGWNRDIVNGIGTGLMKHGPLKAITTINNHGVKDGVVFYAQRRKYAYSQYEWLIWYARSGRMMPYFSANLDDAVRKAYQHAYLMA